MATRSAENKTKTAVPSEKKTKANASSRESAKKIGTDSVSQSRKKTVLPQKAEVSAGAKKVTKSVAAAKVAEVKPKEKITRPKSSTAAAVKVKPKAASDVPKTVASPLPTKRAEQVPTQKNSLVLKVFYVLSTDGGVLILGGYPTAQPKITAAGFVSPSDTTPLVICCRPPKTGALLFEPVSAGGAGESPDYNKFVAYLPSADLAKADTAQFVVLWENGELKRFQASIVPQKKLNAEEKSRVLHNFGDLLKRVSKQLKSAAPAVRSNVVPELPKPRVAQQTPRTAIKGCFDVVNNGYAEGWAFDLANPDRRLNVQIMDGERVVAQGLANGFRQDLLAAGVGDGKHHFKLRVSYELFDGKPHQLKARVEGSSKLLAGVGEITMPPPQFEDLDLVDRATTLKFAERLLGAPSDARERKTLLDRLESACVHMEMLETKRAGEEFLALLDPFKQHGFLCCKLGETLLISGRIEDAAKAYKQALKRTPKLAWAFWGLGNACRLLKAWPEAEAAYRQGLAITPKSLVLQQRLASIRPFVAASKAEQLIAQGDFDTAIRLYKQLLVVSPDNLDVCRKLKEAMARRDKRPLNDFALPDKVQKLEAAMWSLDALLDQIESTGGRRS